MKQGELVFYYVSVKKLSCNHEDIDDLLTKIVKDLCPIIQSLYPKK